MRRAMIAVDPSMVIQAYQLLQLLHVHLDRIEFPKVETMFGSGLVEFHVDGYTEDAFPADQMVIIVNRGFRGGVELAPLQRLTSENIHSR